MSGVEKLHVLKNNNKKKTLWIRKRKRVRERKKRVHTGKKFLCVHTLIYGLKFQAFSSF